MEPIKLIPLRAGRAEVWADGVENMAVDLTYYLSAQLKIWPDAQPTVVFERADGKQYAHSWTMDGPVLHIPLLAADTVIEGMCKCSISVQQGDGIDNTDVFHGLVTQGLDSMGDAPDDPERGVIEQINAAVSRAESASASASATADRLEGAEDRAQLAADRAEEAAKRAEQGNVKITTDATLSLSEDGVLSVNTADNVEADNTLPITSAAVHTTVGNIEILLATI